MNAKAHRLTTRLALDVAAALHPGIWPGKAGAQIVEEAALTDDYRDLEFVDVNAGLDNPHDPRPRPAPDKAHTLTDQRSHTAFNHFLDLRKGPGQFDDYDGYSYYCGSARRDERQEAKELGGGWERLAVELAGFKVDEGIAYWLNDEYVHVPGQRWYRHCSPAAERYSFYRDRGIYASARGEVLARFPLARDPGAPGAGVPYSVFFPVDNLARYWYACFLKHPGRVKFLGPVMHALQDASIPHHAAGCMGNWHVEYENALDEFAESRVNEKAFFNEICNRVGRWLRPPAGRRPALGAPRDRRRVPVLGWAVQDTVTWLARQAYHEYVHSYRNFSGGWRPVPASLKRLLVLAAGASALVLIKARRGSAARARRG